MEAGKLNRRITIQMKSVSYNTYNEPVESWTDIFSTWAEVITSGGNEFYAAQKKNASTQALIKTRPTRAINELNRIKIGSRIFEIIAPPDVNSKKDEMLIAAKEVV